MTRMERTLLQVGGVLDSVGVPFFLILGTALGIVRDGKLIDWDKDIDIGVLVEHLTPVAGKLIGEFESFEFRVKPHTKPVGYIRAMRLVRGLDKVDIAGFLRHAEERYSPSSLLGYSLVYPARIMESYEEVAYLGRQWCVPCPSSEYLCLQYGSSWQRPDRLWDPKLGPARVEEYYRTVMRRG